MRLFMATLGAVLCVSMLSCAARQPKLHPPPIVHPQPLPPLPPLDDPRATA